MGRESRTRKRFLAGVVGTGAALTGLAQLAPLRAARPFRYYEIAGTTAEQLTDAMVARNLRDHKGRLCFAYTKWDLVSDRDICEQTGNGFTIPDDGFLWAHLTARAIVDFPKWVNEPNQEADPLRRQWRTYLAKLDEHELQHARHGEEAAVDVVTAWRELRANGLRAPSCAQLRSRLAEISDRIQRTYQRRDDDYDDRTNRGATQGAVWPPMR